MDYVKLGATDLEVSTVGFGAWQMGGTLWGEVDDELTVAAARRARELGVTLFDTAPGYGYGHSEELLGKAIGEHRDGVVLATKCGMAWDDSGAIARNSRPERLHQEADDCLRRLGTDYIDLLQIHWPDEDVPFAESIGALEEIKQAGKIRCYGVSNFSVEEMTECMKHGRIDTLQPPYSMLRRGVEDELLPYCLENGMGVLAYGSLARGLLTGKYDETATFPDGDLRKNDPDFQGERLQRNVRIVRGLTGFAERYGKTVGQLAIAWNVNNPAVTVALVGAKNPGQVEANVGGSGWALSDEEMAEIESILATD